jgi:uracil-DNA glycosylase
MPAQSLDQLLDDIRACRACAAALPLGPRPVVRLSATARLMICSQAPGLRVHQTGLSFNDPSGDRLREWLGIDRDTFYDTGRVAILPMGFCYPGRDDAGGDLPPRPECAPQWQARVGQHLGAIDLWLLVGGYAQRWHLGDRAKKTLTETVAAWRDYLPRYLPLPHPSWRNNGWLRKNPWFGEELLPYMREQVRARVAA